MKKIRFFVIALIGLLAISSSILAIMEDKNSKSISNNSNNSNNNIKNSTYDKDYDAKVTYSCDDGYTLNNENKCVIYETGKKSIEYRCDNGYSIKNDYLCHKIESGQAILSNDCKSDEEYYNGYCLSASDYEINSIYSCNRDQIFNSNGYDCVFANRDGVHDYYLCVGDKLNVTCSDNSQLFYKYYCKSDEYIIDNKCYKKSSVRTAKISYTCSDGYTMGSTGCYKETIMESGYREFCDDEYKLVDGVCIKETIKSANIGYSCDDGDYLSEDTNKCIGYGENASL